MLHKIWDKLMSESHLNETLMDKCIKMLRVVEQEGMKPPFYEDPFDRSLGESKVYVENYKWEPEDEKA